MAIDKGTWGRAVYVVSTGVVTPSLWGAAHTQVLDIGGTPIPPRFGDKQGAKEVPGIPCHVHAGDVGDDGHCKLHTGKVR